MVEPDTKTVSRALARNKKPAPSPSPAPQKKRRSSQAAIYVGLAAALAMVINLAVGYWGYHAWIQQSRMEQLSALALAQAQTTAGALADQVGRYEKDLATLAETPTIAAAFAENTPEALASVEEQVRRVLPGTASVRAIPRGAATSDTPSELTFTELDMLTRAEDREAADPEAVQQSGDWLLKLVAPVPADASKPVEGVLLVSLPLTNLRPVLEENQTLGKMELQQSFNNQRNTLLLAVGQGSAGAPQTVDVPGTYWQLRFTPSVQLWQQTQVDLMLPLVAWILFACANLALAVFLGRRLSTARGHVPMRRTDEQAAVAAGTGSAATTSGSASYVPEDILDIEIADEDEALLGLEEGETRAAPRTPQTQPSGTGAAAADVPRVIFRAYDIRGLAETEITPQLAQLVGQALGSEALDNNQNALVVARDGRTHSPLLMEHLVRGILSTGCGVVNIGAAPTPLMYFATETLPQTQSGVVVTASHNGPAYNGFKVVINGKSRSADDIQNIRKRILTGNFYAGQGQEEHLDIVPQYIDTIFSDVALAGDIHMVLDAGNGITGQVAPKLFEELGCQVTPLFCDLDGTFPNHAPDPSVANNLRDLVARVQEEKADLGVAFDGDGDRLTVVTPRGKIVWADRLLMLFAKDILSRNPGADVVFDVKSTRQLNSAISNFGGRPVMWKTGHAPMRAKMLETGALVGAEYSGHVFIKDRWYGFDDGIYAAARLIEIISLRGEDLDSMLAEFPPTHITPEILIPVAEERKFAIVRQLQESGDFDEARLTTLDGLRADFPYGWGLLRASNTSANLTLRFEAESESELHKIKALFARELKKIDTALVFE